jgi:lipopolysaccharide assembly protein A
MQALRTILLVSITIVLVAFIAINWTPVSVNFWPLADGNYLHFQWPVGFIVLVSFIAGLLPMWLIARAAKWRLQRRIATLENSVAANSVVAPVATSTQLEAAAPPPPPPPAESPAI